MGYLPQMDGMYQTGEKVNKGHYFCVFCAEEGTLTNVYVADGKKLPQCKIHGAAYWSITM